MSFTMRDQETFSLTDHETGGVDLDMDGTLNNMEYLPLHNQQIDHTSFKGKNLHINYPSNSYSVCPSGLMVRLFPSLFLCFFPRGSTGSCGMRGMALISGTSATHLTPSSSLSPSWPSSWSLPWAGFYRCRRPGGACICYPSVAPVGCRATQRLKQKNLFRGCVESAIANRCPPGGMGHSVSTIAVTAEGILH